MNSELWIYIFLLFTLLLSSWGTAEGSLCHSGLAAPCEPRLRRDPESSVFWIPAFPRPRICGASPLAERGAGTT